jgi:hypothetical protein
MSRNGSGTYNLPAGNPVVTGSTISSTWANTTLNDIATALTGSVAKDGQTTPTANLPMGGYVHTGVGVATLRNQYASASQMQDSATTLLTGISGTNTIVATAALGMSAYATGQIFTFTPVANNTGAVTININGIGAKSITKVGATALAGGDILANIPYQIFYNGTQFQLLQAREIVSVKDFGAVGNGVANDTAAVQAAINAGNYVLFPLGTYNISTPIALHSGSQIDLGGSTIEWTGAVVNNGNKAARWDNTVFYSNLTLDPPSPIKKNVAVFNGTINVNDWGCGVTFKQTENFFIADLNINDAQCGGISVSDCFAGSIDRCILVDCAANPASGFNPTTDLEGWSDGMAVWYGSQNVSVNNCSIINTRVATGRCGIFFEGTSTESGRITSQCSMNNCTVQGYDRQFHVELSNNISAYDCQFNFVASGAKTLNTAVIVWNTTNTNLYACRIVSVNNAITHIQSLNNTFVGCDISSNAAVAGTELFRSLESPTTSWSNFSFIDCFINANLAELALPYMDANFESCTLQTNVYRLNNMYEGNFIFTDCLFNKAGVRTVLGTATNTYDFTNCTWTGFSSVQNPIASTAGIRRVTLTNCEFNGGQVYCESPLEIIGKTIYDYNLFTSGSLKGPIVNGNWYKNATPTTGSWLTGSRIYRFTPTVGQPKSWVCTSSTDTTTGTINASSNSLTVASGTGINNGDSITVAGAGVAGAALVTTVSSGGGTGTLILGTTASTSVVSAAVTTTGTWVSEGNL